MRGGGCRRHRLFQMASAKRIRESALEIPDLREALEHPGSLGEVSAYWNDPHTGVRCKPARPVMPVGTQRRRHVRQQDVRHRRCARVRAAGSHGLPLAECVVPRRLRDGRRHPGCWSSSSSSSATGGRTPSASWPWTK